MGFVVLAADDEIELLDALELYLRQDGIGMLKAKDGVEAMALFQKNEVHLALLDIMMPGLDGFEVLRGIRQTSKIPALMLTARAQDYDKILGLELGADDYITKPYNPMEVVARVKAQLRRSYQYHDQRSSTIMSVPDCGLELNLEEGAVRKNGQEIALTSTEFKILRLLMERPGRVFTRRQIFEQVRDDSFFSDDNTIMVHISNLRNKVEDNPRQPIVVKTIKGLGYKIDKDMVQCATEY